MSASGMTNEELAMRIEYTAAVLPNYGGFQCADELREAAARLRRPEACCKCSRLKVAEDALIVCKNGMCGECRRQHPDETCVNGCYEMAMIKYALAEIRSKGAGNGK